MSNSSHIVIPTADFLPIKQAASSLAAALRRFESAHTSAEGSELPHLVTFSQPIEATDITEWLYHQELYPRLFWKNREEDFLVAGIGVADTIHLETEGDNHSNFQDFGGAIAHKDPHARYFGGFRFNNIEVKDPAWEKFPSCSFVLPLLQLTFENNLYTLSCHLWLEKDDNFQAKISNLTEALERVTVCPDRSTTQLPGLRHIICNPDMQSWVELCRKAIKTFESGDMEKIMLARQTLLEFSESFSPLLFLLNYPYPQNPVYRFYFEPVKDHAFISFTPERLYRRDGNMLLTEALAGTCLKENINGNDHHASEMLLNSDKDIREHNFVREMIYQELLKICSAIEMEEEIQVLQLNRLAHLYTRCVARLKPEFEHDTAILQLLHPTPAVGGVPKSPAMQHIMELEPFRRGWYAAPVGWVSHDAAEFCVAIRSALVNSRFTSLYSGAGLVDGSNPLLEWEEVGQKIGDLMAITRLEA